MIKFTIEKGNHNSKFKFKPYLLKDKVDFKFKLSDNCKYFFGNKNDLIINQLFGISFLKSGNSISIGWRWNIRTGMFDIIQSVFVDSIKVLESDKICSIKPNVIAEASIVIHENEYIIQIINNNRADYICIPKPRLSKIGYYLFPSFGITEPAMHNMDIYLEY